MMRWKKDPRPTGLAGIAAPPSSHWLRDGEIKLACVSPSGRSASGTWYWVAGWDGRELGVSHRNTCDKPVATVEEAKDQAMAYVREQLKAAKVKS